MADRNRRPTPPEKRGGSATRWGMIALIVIFIAVFAWWLYDGTQNVQGVSAPDLEMPDTDEAPEAEPVQPADPETAVEPADPPQ